MNQNMKMKMVNKITAGILTFVMTVSGGIGSMAFAAGTGSASTVTMDQIPPSNFFNTEGTFHNKDAYQKWIDQARAEVRAKNLLNGNYAFCVDSNYYWNLDRQAEANRPAIYNEAEQIVISAEVLESCLGTKFSKKYVTPEEAVKGTAWQSFTDPRGFVMFSKDMSKHISTAKLDENNPQYHSYYDVGLAMGQITWKDVTPTEADWQKARQTVLDELTLIPGTEAKYKDYVDGVLEQGAKLMAQVDQSAEAANPFKNTTWVNSVGNTRDLARVYYVLKITGRTDLDQQKVLDTVLKCIDAIFVNYIGRNISMDNNWFLNRITIPNMATLAMLYVRDEMDTAKLNEYCNVLYTRTADPVMAAYVIPYEYILYDHPAVDYMNPYTTFTNLFWCCNSVMMISMLCENSSRMNYALRYSSQMFDNAVNSGHSDLALAKDGFYEDGSFLYHPDFAYNMGYGKSMFITLADTVNILAGTCFDMKNVYNFDNVFSWVKDGIVPFIYANSTLKMVMGRENPYGNGASGNSPVKAVMLLAIHSGSEQIKEDVAKQLKPIVDEHYDALKTAQMSSTFPNFYWPALNETVDEYLEYIHNMPPVTVEPYNHAYYNIDRFIHKRDDFTFGLAMSSERVSKFEAINDAGYSDWYTSDGMTYVMKDDRQYVQRWWEYVDKYALPGTTVGSNERRVGSVNFYTNIPANNSWAGGVSDGNIGVGGMEYPTESNNPSNVQGLKSYFMLEDKIICLGSNISGGSGNVYTTVENYISYEKPSGVSNPEFERGYVRVAVDGKEVPFEFDKKVTYENPSWLWIGDNRGFVFLGENQVTTERAAKSKRFCGNSGTAYNETAKEYPYFTVQIQHGESPKQGKYGYVILPNKSMAETKSYAQSFDFEVLEQSDTMHAIRLNNGTIMANIFKPATLEKFMFMTPCAAILKPLEEGGYHIYVSDPTQKQKTIRIGASGEKNVNGNFVTTKDGVIMVDATVNYGRSYDFYYGAEAGSDDTNATGGISVRDINLELNSNRMSTKLYGKSIEADETVQFKIHQKPKTGISYIIGDRLYYYAPSAATDIDETIMIEAYDEKCHKSYFTVKITR